MRLLVIAAAFVTLGLLSRGGVMSARAESPPDVFYWSPFEYCRAVGTVDHPDGMQVWRVQTPEMARAIADAWGAPPDAPFRLRPPSLAWRCMEGLVYACTWGANLQCYARVNFDTQPVTGRATAYAWKCQEGLAVAYGEPAAADAQGYFERLWYVVAE